MNLFELFVKIGVKDEASKNVESISKKLGGGLKKAAGIGVKAVTAASTAIAGLTTLAVKNYAEYEQLVGGVDTLFKGASKKVQAYADAAYKTAGMSANDYMSVVTSFSASLIQSLEGDTEKAAEKADMAIRDMSDNANKFGSDIETLKTAYAGFAKGQFMLLDNLKLGYGGTQAEMKRLLEDAEAISGIEYDISSYADIVDAIHVIQDEMGVAGATALEASTTIEGSVNTMKAAWKNLTVEIAKENGNIDESVNKFVESVSTVADNIAPVVEKTLDGIVKFIDGLMPKVVDAIPKLVSEFAPKLIKSGVNILNSLVKGIKNNAKVIVNAAKDIVLNLIDGLVDMLPDIIEAGVELLSGIIEAIPEVVVKIGEKIPDIIEAIVKGLLKGVGKIGSTVGKVFESLFFGADQVESKLSSFIETLTPFMDKVNEVASKSRDLTRALSDSGKTISEIDDEIQTAEDEITNILKTSFSEQEKERQLDLEKIRKYNDEIRNLTNEKLGIYQDSQRADLVKAQLGEGDLSREQASELFGGAKSSYEDTKAVIQEAYEAEIIRIENIYKARGEVGTKAYQKALDDAKLYYDNLITESEKVYNETVVEINKSAKDWILPEIETWQAMAEGMEEFRKEQRKFPDFLSTGTNRALEEVAKIWGNTLAQMDLDAASAFLSMIASAVAAGETLDDEVRDYASVILSVFDDLPEEMDEKGRETLLYLIGGLEEHIPKLKNASSMTTETIIQTLEEELGYGKIESIGRGIGEGLASGINAWRGELATSMSKIAYTMRDAFSFALDINSPSKVFQKQGKYVIDGLVKGLDENKSSVDDEMRSIAESMSSGFPQKVVDVSPSLSGFAYDPFETLPSANQNVNFEVSIKPEGSDLGRALLNLIEITKREVSSKL